MKDEDVLMSEASNKLPSSTKHFSLLPPQRKNII